MDQLEYLETFRLATAHVEALDDKPLKMALLEVLKLVNGLRENIVVLEGLYPEDEDE